VLQFRGWADTPLVEVHNWHLGLGLPTWVLHLALDPCVEASTKAAAPVGPWVRPRPCLGVDSVHVAQSCQLCFVQVSERNPACECAEDGVLLAVSPVVCAIC
jgi:hypothetical protein